MRDVAAHFDPGDEVALGHKVSVARTDFVSSGYQLGSDLCRPLRLNFCLTMSMMTPLQQCMDFELELVGRKQVQSQKNAAIPRSVAFIKTSTARSLKLWHDWSSHHP